MFRAAVFRVLCIFVVTTISSGCSNPLGGASAADETYRPGAAGSAPAPIPTPFPPPSLMSVSPNAGRSSGGQLIVLSGSGFREGLAIRVGGSACSTSNYISSTSASCQLPAGAAISRVDISLTNDDGQLALLERAFTFVGSPVTWLKADALTSLANGDSVQSWVDASVTPNAFEQSNSANRPTFVANGLNGLPVVRFSGGQTMVSERSFSLSGSAARTTLFVAKKASATNNNIFGWGVAGTNRTYDVMNYAGRLMVHFYVNDTYSVGPTFAPNVWSIIGSDYDGSLARVSINDNQSPPQSIALDTGTSLAELGGGAYSSYDGYDGDIAEVLVLPQVLTGAERSAVLCYLNEKYALNVLSCP